MEHELSIGERIRYHRRRRGLSQTVLGDRVGRSESWVSQVERGDLPVERLSVLIRVAEALHVELSELTGRPLRLAPNGPPHHEVAAVTRTALSSYVSVPAQPDAVPPDLATLRASVARLGQTWQRSSTPFSATAHLLGPALAGTEAAVRGYSGDDLRERWRLRAQVWWIASIATKSLGETELAWLAADRAVLAAEQADDPLLVAAGLWRVSHAHMEAGRLVESIDVALRALPLVRDGIDAGSPLHLSAHGGLHLAAALAAARDTDQRAWELLREAEAAGRALGEDRDDLWMTFGPTNVAMHAVQLEVEFGRPAEAIRLAEDVDPVRMPSVHRQFAYHHNLARGYGQRRDDAAALLELLESERVSGERLRHDVLSRELVRNLLRRERRTIREPLRGLASRMGIL